MENFEGWPLWLILVSFGIGPAITAIALIISNALNTRANGQTAERTEKTRAQAEKDRLQAEERRLRLQLDADRLRLSDERLFEHRLDAVADMNTAFYPALNQADLLAQGQGAVADYMSTIGHLHEAVGKAVTVFPAAVDAKAVQVQTALNTLRHSDETDRTLARDAAVTARNDFVRAARDTLITSKRDPENQPPS